MTHAADASPARRLALAHALCDALAGAVPGSTAVLRGSLADGRADAWSDVDLTWTVPDARFDDAVARVPGALARVRPLASLRADPALQRSRRRRLLFARLDGVPLFWRVDLALFAASVAGDWTCDLADPAARGTDWSWPESAHASAVAALRATHRGRDGEAAALLARAAARLGVPLPDGGLRARIDAVAAAAVAREPRLRAHAREIVAHAARVPDAR